MTDRHQIKQAPPRVLSYERVSGAAQVGGTGLGRQSDMAARYCEARGWELDEITTLKDEGKSAWRGKHLKEGALGKLLDLCEAGEIPKGSVLLVEALDRLSRLEAMVGLDDIVFKLIRGYGVTIITLEDHQEYSRERLRDDTSAGLVLWVKIQTAFEYSQRASRRLRAAYVDRWGDARRGKWAPIHYKVMPKWITLDRQSLTVSLNEHADSLRLMFKLLEDNGLGATAKILNERKVPPIYGKGWGKSSMSTLLNNDATFGTLTLRRRLAVPTARQKELKKQGVELDEQCPGVLPAALEESYVRHVRARVAQRASHPGRKGRITSMKWFGQGLTRCACGFGVGRIGKKDVPRLACKSAGTGKSCGRKSARMERVGFHVLSRLSPRQLEQLTGGAQDRDAELLAAVKAEQVAAGLLTEAERIASNTLAAMQQAIAEGWELGPFHTAQADAKAKQDAAKQAHAEAQGAVTALQSDRHYGSLHGPVEDLRQAMLAGTDTAEQRRAVNKGLRDLGIQILIDDDRVGIQLGDGDPVWQPLASLRSERAALAGGYTDSERIVVDDVTITLAPALA